MGYSLQDCTLSIDAMSETQALEIVRKTGEVLGGVEQGVLSPEEVES
jgi:hypothetical protein